MSSVKSQRWFLAIIACSFVTAVGLGNVSNEDIRAKHEQSVTVAARALKDVYEPNEPVRVVVAIANHSPQPVYISTDRPGILDPFIRVKDAHGIEVKHDPIPTPPPPPLHYYMEKDGKQVYVVPVSKIEGPGVLLSVIPDGLKIYHKHLSEGVYYLAVSDIEIIHALSSLIIREDVPHPLWVEPKSVVTRLRHKLEPIKIQIQRKPEVPESVAQVQPFAWLTFLLGAVVAIGAVCLILLVKKRPINRSE